MSTYQVICLLSSVLSSFAFIDDDLTKSVSDLTFVTISNLPETSAYVREIDISDNVYGVPPSKYKLGCPDDATITFYGLANDYSLTATKQSDYQAMCAGSSTVGSCIAYKGEQIISVSDPSTISSSATFDKLKTDNFVIFDGILTESDVNAISEIQTIYDVLRRSMTTFLVTSTKLATGGDYGNGDCVDRFHKWSMYLSKAYSTEISDPKWNTFTDEASCITEATRLNGQRPSDLTDAYSKCSNTKKRASERASAPAADGGGRRLQASHSYISAQIQSFINDENLCPDGFDISDSCNNAYFGRCGPDGTCWDWVCGVSSWNSNSGTTNDGCGCNNGCFEHDYYCSCVGTTSINCAIPISALYADKTCHAGSTCVDVKKMENIASKNSCADCDWGWGGCSCERGEPYVDVEPRTPDGPYKETEDAGNNYGGNSYTFNHGRLCFSMRFTDFDITLYDDDGCWGCDDNLWESVVATNVGSGITVGSGTGSTPKITFDIEKRGW